MTPRKCVKMTKYNVQQDLKVGERVKIRSCSNRTSGSFGLGIHFQSASGVVKEIKRFRDGIIKEIMVDNIIVRSDLKDEQRTFPHFIPIIAKAKKWINEDTNQVFQVDYKSNSEQWFINRENN